MPLDKVLQRVQSVKLKKQFDEWNTCSFSAECTLTASIDAMTLGALCEHGLTQPETCCLDTYVCVAACGKPILIGDIASDASITAATATDRVRV